MSRYRLILAPAQEAVLRDHCAHARYVWNLAGEQHAHWRPGRTSAPGYLEQCRQLTAARAGHDWLRAGSQMVQQQALRDFTQAMAAFFDSANPAGRPTWRQADRDESHADVNAARNIAAGHAVTARGGCRDAGPVNREPQLLASLTGCQ